MSNIKELKDGLTVEVIQEKYSWLFDANIEDAILGVDEFGLVWYNGTWKQGKWLNGTWFNGTWFNGTWLNGTWEYGLWHGGVFKGGVWKGGIVVHRKAG